VAETKAGLRLLTQQPARLSDVGSEGERRALALAFFFAELSVAGDTHGIVVDDPVSSLDDERRDYIAHRLVTEAQKRQVIVFTHDLPFVFALRSQAKKADIPLHFQHIWRLGQDVGRVDGHPPFKTMNLRERIGKLEKELLEAKDAPPPADYEEAWRWANGFYQRVRTSWERAVEERLFAGVVERFERDVKTQRLKDVKITDELIAQVTGPGDDLPGLAAGCV
jgi:AAA domain-containing protein